MLIWLIVVREIDIFCPNYAKILGHFDSSVNRIVYIGTIESLGILTGFWHYITRGLITF